LAPCSDIERRRHIVHLLQCITQPTGIDNGVDAIGWESIVYNMNSEDAQVILSHVNCDSVMSDALRLIARPA
jgi:hypothetical protein